MQKDAFTNAQALPIFDCSLACKKKKCCKKYKKKGNHCKKCPKL